MKWLLVKRLGDQTSLDPGGPALDTILPNKRVAASPPPLALNRLIEIS